MLGFKHATRGLRLMLQKERNFKIQLGLFLVLIITGLTLGIHAIEWAILLICSALVLSLETINTAIEKTCNHITRAQHPEIKNIKDISAAAVLIAAILAIVVATLIFYPYLFN